MVKCKNKSGFSLLELILSIIVIAIVSLSVPTIISQTAQANARSLLQESVMSAKTYMALVLKSPFTCEHINTHPNSLLPIFYGQQLDGAYQDFYQQWGLAGDGRRFFMPKIYSETNRTANPPVTYETGRANLNLGCGAGSIKSINDFAGAADGINNTFAINTNNPRDFIVGSTYTVAVNNNDNSFGANLRQDVKRIIVTATLNNAPAGANNTIVLSGFAANIGDSGGTLLSRVWR